MSIRKPKPEVELAAPDAAAPEAPSDEEIDRQIAANPDAAPDCGDWSLYDQRVVIMQPIDVKAIRTRLGMSQPAFANAFGVSVSALRDWEQQRRAARPRPCCASSTANRKPRAAP